MSAAADLLGVQRIRARDLQVGQTFRTVHSGYRGVVESISPVTVGRKRMFSPYVVLVSESAPLRRDHLHPLTWVIANPKKRSWRYTSE